MFVCGLQEGELPQRPVPEPFLDDGARAELAKASGLVLPRHEDTLPRERSLFYACVSRPEEALFLSFRSSDEEGGPQQPSPFLDDVRALFTDELWEGRGRRLLAEITWPPAEAPTPHELRRSQAAAEERPAPAPLDAPADPVVLATLAQRDRESARGLETFAGCPVKWLIEHVLRPGPVDPDPEPMRRGSLGHAVLERTLRGLKQRTGSARLTPETLDGGAGRAADRDRRAPGRLAHDPRQGRRPRAGGGPRALHPPRGDDRRGLRARRARMELRRADDRRRRGERARRPDRRRRHPGDRPRLQGQDRLPGREVGRGRPDPGRALRARRARAVRAGHRRRALPADRQPPTSGPAGSSATTSRAATSTATWSTTASLDATLEASRAVAAQAAADLRAGRIRPCPDRCAYNGGCAHPGICRS